MKNSLATSASPDSVEVYPLLRYQLTTGTGRREDAEGYLLDFRVKIVGMCSEADDHDAGCLPNGDIHLGHLRATLIRVGRAWEEGFPLLEIFDHSGELDALGSALFDLPSEGFADHIEAAFPNALPNPDLLYIRQLTLRSIAQGQRAGISALHRFITDWEGGCSLVALRSRPMQFEPDIRGSAEWDDLQLGSFSQDQGVATAKLEQHFAGLGFRKVDGVPYQLLCPDLRQAPLEELALEDRLVVPRSELQTLV